MHNGFIRIDNAFPRTLAETVIDILWKDLPFDRYDPSTWTEPVFRLGMYAGIPFVGSVNSPELHAIFDQLAGAGNWIAPQSVGTFPVRFPTIQQPADTGKHVDAGFPGEVPGNYMEWRINIKSKGRALLMLVLYSDIGEKDAPTIIYSGSHLNVARLLADKGDAGLSFLELAGELDNLPERQQELATGKAGTIYLCHPFLVHAAQSHNGTHPKFMAQPPLLLKKELLIDDTDHLSPVEQAIRMALRQ